MRPAIHQTHVLCTAVPSVHSRLVVEMAPVFVLASGGVIAAAVCATALRIVELRLPLSLAVRCGPSTLTPLNLLVLSHDDVAALLPMDACIALMHETLSGLARGEYFQPLRSRIRPPGAAGVFGLMPAYRATPMPYFGLKEVCVFPGNAALGLDAHQGLVVLHDGTNGQPLAAMNAHSSWGTATTRAPSRSIAASFVVGRPRARRPCWESSNSSSASSHSRWHSRRHSAWPPRARQTR